MSSIAKNWKKLFGEMAWKAAEYEPTPEQAAFHFCPARLRLVAGGVGAGKSYSTAMEILRHMGIINGLGWIIGPSYDLCNPEFEYCLDICRKLEVVDENSVILGMNRSRRFRLLPRYGGFTLATKSATNPEAIAGQRPHVVAAVEAAQQPYEMLWKVLERAMQEDAIIIFSGTFEGSYGWYAELWEKWQGPNVENGVSFSIPTWSNLKHYPGGRQDPKIVLAESMWPPELFMERFGGIPCKPEGLVFKEFDRAVHVKPVEELYDPSLPVELWVDPATHTYSVLFAQVQKDGKTVHILDELYSKDSLGQQIIPQIVRTRWWRDSCTSGVIDAAGTRRSGAGKSQIQVWEDTLRELGEHQVSFGWREIRDVRLWYDAIHLRLYEPKEGQPLLYFSSSLNDRLTPAGDAEGILGEFKSHRWPERKTTSAMPSRPTKRNEDALSALGYGLYFHFGPVTVRKQGKLMPRKAYF